MKTKLLLVFLAMSVISCSDDDSNPTTPPVEKNLAQMLVKRYQNNGSIYKDVYDFDDDNKLTIVNRYNGQDENFSKTTYEYNENGLLSVAKTYGYGMGDPNQPTGVASFDYDESLRIIKIYSIHAADIESTETTTHFTYNNNSTISAHETVVGPPSEDVITNFVFYKDTNGRIVKKEDAEGVVYTQAVYNDGNVESYSQLNSPSMSYLFNTANTPKGDYLNINLNRFGGNFNNAILSGGFASVSNGVANYISQQTSTNATTSQITTYTYEFDEDGYPVKVSLFKQGSTEPYEVREITYQE